MSAMSSLADELLRLILAPSLSVSHNQLISPSPTTFGGNDAVSSASVLVVCKKWLRVATPLLYETVIVRSTGQSHALAKAFGRSPQFAKYVKKLRLEGAYVFIGDVLKQCTNLITFVLLLHIYSDAKVTGLCRSLPSINPTEVILRDTSRKENAKVRKVFMALCDSIPKWKNLNSFWYPYGIGEGVVEIDPGSGLSRRDLLMDALSKSRSLQRFYAPSSQLKCTQWRQLASNPIISFSFYYDSRTGLHVEALSEDAQPIESPIEFIDISETSPRPQPKSCVGVDPATSFKRLSFDFINDDVWSMIFAFAAVPGYPNPPENYSSGYRVNIDARAMNKTRKSISLTCKRFERLVRPLFFAFPLLTSLRSLEKFTEQILETPALGCRVRVLTCDIDTFRCTGPDDILPVLLPHLTNLLHFDSWHAFSRLRMTAKVLKALADVGGKTLLTLSGFQFSDDLDPASLTAFESFRCLRSLDAPSGLSSPRIPVFLQPDSLQTLRNLRVDGPGQLFDILCTLRLPALKSVSFLWAPAGEVEKFLESSVPNIEELVFVGIADIARVFVLAPSLVSLEWVPPGINGRYYDAINIALHGSASHEKLEKLTIRKVAGRDAGEKHQNFAVSAIFERLNLRKFPSLKELCFPAYEWPVEERSISRQLLPKMAIQLKQAHGVDILDGSEKPWRPRAQMDS